MQSQNRSYRCFLCIRDTVRCNTGHFTAEADRTDRDNSDYIRFAQEHYTVVPDIRFADYIVDSVGSVEGCIGSAAADIVSCTAVAAVQTVGCCQNAVVAFACHADAVHSAGLAGIDFSRLVLFLLL